MVVDLPAPLGPRKAVTEPRGTEKVMFCTAVKLAVVLAGMPSAWMGAGPVAGATALAWASVVGLACVMSSPR